QVGPHVCKNIVLRRSFVPFFVPDTESNLGVDETLVSRSAYPPHTFRIVFRDAMAISVHCSEPPLGLGVTLLGGKAKPLYTRGGAFRAGHHADSELRVDVALFRSLSKPLQRLGLVSRHTFRVIVHHAEVVLRGGVALFRSLSKPRQRLHVVLWDAFAIVVHRT